MHVTVMWDFEAIFALLLWIGGVSYALYGVFNVGTYFQTYDDKYGDFEDGWIVNRKKDVACIEWQTVVATLRIAIPWLIVHAIVAECFRYKKFYKLIPWWQFMLGLSFTFYVIGIWGCIILVQQVIIFEACYRFRHKAVIWICSCVCLSFLTYIKSLRFEDVLYKLFLYKDTETYFLTIVVYWMHLHCLSYYLEVVGNKKMQHSLIQVFSYCFYLPTLFLGPFISFSSFERSKKCYTEQTLWHRLKVLLGCIFRFGSWYIVTEYFLHYLYVNALMYQPEVVRNLSSWALYGYGYGMGQFFHLKYVVFYGVSTSLAKFEHIMVPPTPKCIGRIHLYSDMWRYFDVGLYKFLIRYIYVPSLIKNNFLNKAVSSFLCFAFVYVWHGVENHILVWTILNYIGITIENIFTNISSFHNINKWFHFKWQRRLLCILSSVLLAASALSNFYYFAGMEIGLIFTERLLYDVWYSTTVLLMLLTCCSYVSTEVKRMELSSNNNMGY